jgi:hypothetical protein
MQKTLSWLTGLATGGLIVVALNVYWNHHPDLFRRFTPEIKPAEQANQESDEEVASEEPEPIHFLGEQAVAQEYYKRADLPFNLAPAGFAKPDKPEDDEDASAPHAPKNRLPGKITFEEEPQESSEFDSLFKASDDGDDVIPLNKTAGPEENGPDVMSYCADDDEEKREMPYAEQEGPLGQVGLINGPRQMPVFIMVHSLGHWIVFGQPESRDWRDFIEKADRESASAEAENEPIFNTMKISGTCIVNGKCENSVTWINPKAWRAFVREGIKKAESKAGWTFSFSVSDVLPFVDESGIAADESEPIDTIWPFNLMDETRNYLMSQLPPQRLNRCEGDVNYPVAMRKVLDQQDGEYLRQNYPLVNQDKPSRISSEELISCVETVIWPWNLLMQSIRGQHCAYDTDPNQRMTEMHGPSEFPKRTDIDARLQALIDQAECSYPIDYEPPSGATKKSKSGKSSKVILERVHGGIQ